MITFTTYDAEGRFLQQFEALDLAEAALNIPAGGGMIAGRHDLERRYMRDGIPVDYPPRPGEWAAFDYAAGAWVDPRPVEILFAEAELELEAWRSRQSASRADFCLALVELGALTVAEAIEAAKGDLPAPLEPMLSGLAPQAQADVRIRWAAAQTIERKSAFVDLLAGFLVLSAEEVDTLFARPA